MTINATSYGEFSLALHNRFAGKRAPMEVSLEVTRRCPLECQHCYNNLAMGDLPARNRELTKEEYFAILGELADMGVIWLLFTGGEIFARKDFLEIAARLGATTTLPKPFDPEVLVGLVRKLGEGGFHDFLAGLNSALLFAAL